MKVIYEKEYRVFLGEDVFAKLSETLIERSYSNVFVLVDEQTERMCLPVLSSYLETFYIIKMPSGEQNKNLESASKIWSLLQHHFADRKSVLINIGGGVLCDLGGFCAATFKRGIDFINVPTTLLAMVDAAIGGKQGIDFNLQKNSVGVFQHPTDIFIYPGFIKTLTEEERRNGLAELVKHALVADEKLWKRISKNQLIDYDNLEKLVERSVKIKIDIVKKDPLEKGLRKALNFGHTIGHAIESYSLEHDGKHFLKHGEAVAIGMVCEAYLSHRLLGFDDKDLKLLKQFVAMNFKKYHYNWNLKELHELMMNDKKNTDGKISFTLLKRAGKAKIDMECNPELVNEALEFYRN